VAGGYALAPKKRPPWLAAADGLDAFDFPDTAADLRGFLRLGVDQSGTQNAQSNQCQPANPEISACRKVPSYRKDREKFAGQIEKMARLSNILA